MDVLPRAALSFMVGVAAGVLLLFATGILGTQGAEAYATSTAVPAPAPASPVSSDHAPKARKAAKQSSDRSLAEVSGKAPAEARDKPKKKALPSDPCERNIQIAASKGLTLPKGWEMHCVGPGLDWDGNTHWGVTCPYSDCPEGAGPYVSVSNPTYYVISHELCHANFGNDELMADSCAAKHGASLATSPYQG